MEMPTSEIVQRFRNAADKKQQIEILAQMNLCSPEEIRDVLIKGGIDQRTLPRRRKADASEKEQISVQPSSKEMSDIIDEALRRYKKDLQAKLEQMRASIAECEEKIRLIDVTIGENK